MDSCIKMMMPCPAAPLPLTPAARCVLPADDDFGGGAPAPAPSADPFAGEDDEEEEPVPLLPCLPASPSGRPPVVVEAATVRGDDPPASTTEPKKGRDKRDAVRFGVVHCTCTPQ